jgi:hypothetical protein
VTISPANIAELGDQAGASDAPEWWHKAYDQLLDMKRLSILQPTDEDLLVTFQKKAGVVARN